MHVSFYRFTNSLKYETDPHTANSKFTVWKKIMPIEMLLAVILFVDEINAFINNLIPSLSKHILSKVRVFFYPKCSSTNDNIQVCTCVYSVYHSVKSPSCNCHVFTTWCTKIDVIFIYTYRWVRWRFIAQYKEIVATINRINGKCRNSPFKS